MLILSSNFVIRMPCPIIKMFATLWFFLCVLPVAYAQDAQPFPDIKFGEFSDFIQHYFSPDVSLSVVLCFLFTVIRNPGLLLLHYHCQSVMSDMARRLDANWGSQMAKHLLAGWAGTDVLPNNIGRSADCQVSHLTRAIEQLLVVLNLENEMRSTTSMA
jgi:hypothetical protein